MENVSRCLQS